MAQTWSPTETELTLNPTSTTTPERSLPRTSLSSAAAATEINQNLNSAPPLAKIYLEGMLNEDLLTKHQ